MTNMIQVLLGSFILFASFAGGGSDGWKAARMERLGTDGGWTLVGTAAAQTVLPFTCEAMAPEFIRLVKKGK